jgi:predicted anti-sigma-YlaC factor YlaD
MKCSTVERWILRDEDAADSQTGEQLSWRQKRIQSHLNGCAACRQWLEDYRKIALLAEADLPAGGPSQTVLTNIRREARVRAAEPDAHTGWAMPWLRPAYGLATVAALCLVLVGGWWLRPDPNGFGNEAQLSTILLLMTEEAEDVDSEKEPPLPSEVEEIASLDALAEQLLMLQGLDAGYTDVELSSQDEVPQATDPLTRSSAASRAERYG